MSSDIRLTKVSENAKVNQHAIDAANKGKKPEVVGLELASTKATNDQAKTSIFEALKTSA